MLKKDRIAIVLSIIWLLITITIGIEEREVARSLFWALFPLTIYWGYRFVKNDISFLKNNSED